MVYLIIVLSVLARFIPHLHNFSPVYGALLFGGAHPRKRASAWFPVVLLVASDVVLTNFVYHLNIGWMELFQAAAFASIAAAGWWLRRRATVPQFFLASCAGPTAFLLDQQLRRLVWLAKLSPDVGRTVRMLYRRHPLL